MKELYDFVEGMTSVIDRETGKKIPINGMNDPEAVLHHYEFFKQKLQEQFPDMSLQDFVKYYERYNDFTDFLKWRYAFEYFDIMKKEVELIKE